MISIESEERPWGRFFVLHDEPTYKLKRIEVDPGEGYPISTIINALEAWTIVEGVGTITLDGLDQRLLKRRDESYTSRGKTSH